MNTTLGSDIEFFLRHKNGGMLTSAIPLILGGKHDPIFVDGVALSHDNVALEFAIPMSHTVDEAVMNVRKALLISQEMVGEGVELSEEASAVFPDFLLQDDDAKLFGCEPDFSVYTMHENRTQAPQSGLRSAGAHLHLGNVWLLETGNLVRFVKWIDATLGLAGVLADPSAAARERRKLYGKAGCIRPKDYGVELRSTSNWICRTPDVNRGVWNMVLDMLEKCGREVVGSDPNVSDTLEDIQENEGISVRDTIDNVRFADAVKLASAIERKTGIGIFNLAELAISYRGSVVDIWR